MWDSVDFWAVEHVGCRGLLGVGKWCYEGISLPTLYPFCGLAEDLLNMSEPRKTPSTCKL